MGPSGKRCRFVLVALSLVWRLGSASLPHILVSDHIDSCRTFRENKSMLVTCEADGEQPEGSTFVAYIGDEPLPTVDSALQLFGRRVSLADSGKRVFCADSAGAPEPGAELKAITVTVLDPAGPSALKDEPECKGGIDHVKARVKAGGGHLVYAWTRERGTCLNVTDFRAPPPKPLGDDEFEYVLWLPQAENRCTYKVFAHRSWKYELYLDGKKAFSCITNKITYKERILRCVFFLCALYVTFIVCYGLAEKGKKLGKITPEWHMFQ